jgi:hypothetical protein
VLEGLRCAVFVGLETHCPVQIDSLPPLRFFDGVSLLRVSSLSRKIPRRWARPALRLGKAVAEIRKTWAVSALWSYVANAAHRQTARAGEGKGWLIR